MTDKIQECPVIGMTHSGELVYEHIPVGMCNECGSTHPPKERKPKIGDIVYCCLSEKKILDKNPEYNKCAEWENKIIKYPAMVMSCGESLECQLMIFTIQDTDWYAASRILVRVYPYNKAENIIDGTWRFRDEE